jgi:hypothetical protein
MQSKKRLYRNMTPFYIIYQNSCLSIFLTTRTQKGKQMSIGLIKRKNCAEGKYVGIGLN